MTTYVAALLTEIHAAMKQSAIGVHPNNRPHYIVDGINLRFTSLSNARAVAAAQKTPTAVLFGPHHWQGVRTEVDRL